MRLTLGQVFVLATIAVAIVVGGAFVHFSGEARTKILASSERRRIAEAERVETRVLFELGRAERTLDSVERGVHAGSIGVESTYVIEPAMFTALLGDDRLEEIAFTRGTLTGYDAEGEAILDPASRWQVSVFREPDGGITTRLVRSEGGAFAALARRRGRDARFATGALVPGGPAKDPTTHATFAIAASKSRRGIPIWSDLHWSEIDQMLPPSDRRVVLTVQKSIDDGEGHFVGVLRVGVLTNDLDAIVKETQAALPGHRVALMTTEPTDAPEPTTRSIALVARLTPEDRVAEVGTDLRIMTAKTPPELSALIASPITTGLDPDMPRADGMLTVDGQPWLATIRAVDLGRGGTRGWLVAILVPEAVYTQELASFERMMVVASGITLALVLLISAIVFGAVRRGLGRVASTTTRMRAFDFAPAKDRSMLKDVDDVMTGLERAKTVVRAMGKYIPIDSVRKLYASNEEPRLGGELAEVSLMFTDIEGFTSLSEKLPPDELAARLGDYLAAMTNAIEATGGTIDKYIGDAVMAMWNAPSPTEDHAARACRAALACMESARALYASDAWKGLPALVTRFGLHEAKVMVGHFGAPTRISYTALGDGVNLAARLEPLCKQYGIVVLASGAIVKKASGAFVFRRIDRVAVKGKSEHIDVYELLGARGDAIEGLDRATRYEEAFDAYLARRFDDAIAILEPLSATDPPSEILLARCKKHAIAPPPESWSGIHVASSK